VSNISATSEIEKLPFEIAAEAVQIISKAIDVSIIPQKLITFMKH